MSHPWDKVDPANAIPDRLEELDPGEMRGRVTGEVHGDTEVVAQLLERLAEWVRARGRAVEADKSIGNSAMEDIPSVERPTLMRRQINGFALFGLAEGGAFLIPYGPAAFEPEIVRHAAEAMVHFAGGVADAREED